MFRSKSGYIRFEASLVQMKSACAYPGCTYICSNLGNCSRSRHSVLAESTHPSASPRKHITRHVTLLRSHSSCAPTLNLCIQNSAASTLQLPDGTVQKSNFALSSSYGWLTHCILRMVLPPTLTRNQLGQTHCRRAIAGSNTRYAHAGMRQTALSSMLLGRLRHSAGLSITRSSTLSARVGQSSIASTGCTAP